MLEILILIGLCKRLGAKARAKGYPAGWFQALLVLMWFAGELGGGCLGGIVGALGDATEEPSTGMIYLFALAGAVIGAVLAFVIVGCLDSKIPDNDPRVGEYFQPPTQQAGGPNDAIRSAPPERPQTDDRFQA